MTGLVIHLDVPGAPEGAVVPLEILNLNTGRTVHAVARCGMTTEVETDAAPLYVQATLTDGQALTAFADAHESTRLRLAPPSTTTQGARSPMSEHPAPETVAQAHMAHAEPYRGAWACLWRPCRRGAGGSDGAGWESVPFKPIDLSEESTGLGWRIIEAAGCALEVGGDVIAQRSVILPPAAALTVTLMRTTGGAPDFDAGYALRVRSRDEQAEALLAYSTAGQLTSADIIARHYLAPAERVLDSKALSPLGAIIGGYYLLRSRSLGQQHDWPTDLADRYPRLPDAACIRMGQLLQSPEPDRSELHARALQAVRAGLPSYTDGLRWLYRTTGLLCSVMEDDQELQDVHRTLRSYADAADWDAALTSFRGSPVQPTVERQTGLPRNTSAAEGMVLLTEDRLGHPDSAPPEDRWGPAGEYGVLSAAVVDRRRADTDGGHYQIHLRDSLGTDYRAAVDVLPRPDTPLLYLVLDDFRHPLTTRLPTLADGWACATTDVAGLDFVRGNLFDPGDLRTLEPELAPFVNDLQDLLDAHVQQAIDDPRAVVHVFGRRFGPDAHHPDEPFGFLPGNGVYDIHMNQGSAGRFRGDDRVGEDGGLLIHLAGEQRWVAIFLAFVSQSWYTDNLTGHTAHTLPPTPGSPIRIVSALVGPVGVMLGVTPAAETVTLVNATNAAVDLSGWRLADQQSHSLRLPAESLPAGAEITVAAQGAFKLGNHGGVIALHDPTGARVHNVSYTSHEAPDAGGIIAFGTPE
ncbi:DUF2278 family protein [Kitasatospora sp. NPDC090091]|uniref:DUF2278 family protein n=1 Tax=Kitasatospora sp. NPDC090091 TaxID=3364081 RepID=UPI00381AF5DC